MINILLHNLNINIKLKYHDDGILCSHLAVQICSARTEHRYVLSLQKLINWDGNIVESWERVGWDVGRCMENWRGRCSKPNPRQETEKCKARPTSHSGYLCVVCRGMGSMSTSPALDYKQTCFWLNMLWLVEWLLITNECQVRKTQKDQITCLHCLSEGAFIPITNWLNSFMAWWYEISGALGVIKIIIHIICSFMCW